MQIIILGNVLTFFMIKRFRFAADNKSHYTDATIARKYYPYGACSCFECMTHLVMFPYLASNEGISVVFRNVSQ